MVFYGSAKKKAATNGGILEKRENESNEESREGFAKLESSSEKEDGFDLGIASEAERESNGVSLDGKNERVFGGRTADLVTTSSLKTENRGTSIDSSNGTVKEQIVGCERSAENEVGSRDKYRLPLKHPIGKWVGQDDNEINMNKSEFVNSSREKGIGETSAQVKGSAASLRSRV